MPALAAAVRRAGDNLGQLAHQGLDAVSERTSRAIAVSADSVTTQVKRVADLYSGVDNKVVATGLQAAVRVSLPGAQVALALSERVAAGADKLAAVAAGAKAGRAAKTARKRVRTAKAEAADVVADVKVQARKVAARPQVKKAVAATAQPAKRSRAKAVAVVQAAQDAAASVAAA